MTMLAKKGSFALNAATGNQAISGLGFQPKVVIFWVGAPIADATITANDYLSLGYAVSSTARGCICSAATDGSAVPNQVSRRVVSTKCLRIENASFVAQAEADLVSLDSDGFTINLTTATPAYVVHYLALGGTDIVNANILTGQLTDTTTGNHAHTGMGFQPDFLLFLHGGGITTIDANSTNFELAVGATDGVDQGTSVMEIGTSSNPTAGGSYEVGTATLASLAGAGATKSFEASIVSMDADGWTWNVGTADSAGHPLLVLGMKGGNYSIKADTQKTSTGTQAKTGVGFQPVAALILSANAVASGSVNAANGRYSIGGSDGSTEGSLWGGFTTGSTTTFSAKTYSNAGKAIVMGSTPSTIDAAADVQSFDADGYTLNWTTADATARELLVILFGSSSVATPAPTVKPLLIRPGLQRLNPLTISPRSDFPVPIPIQPIAPSANVAATSTVGGSVVATRPATPTTNVAATSTCGGTVTAQKKATPTTNVSATSTVSGAVRKIGAVKPTTNVSATSTVSGAVVALRAIKPTTISATSTVSGAVGAARRVSPATVSATSTVSGTVVMLKKVSGNVAATSTVAGSVGHIFKVTPANIGATSAVTGTVSRARNVTPTTNISATSTVSGSVRMLKRVGGNVAATSTVSGVVTGLKRATPATVNATSTVSGSVVAARRVAPASIAATSTVTGSVVKRAAVVAATISATSTVSGSVGHIFKITVAQVSATSTVSGSVHKAGAVRPTNVSATSTVTGSVGHIFKITTTNVSATSTVSGFVVKGAHIIPTTNISATSTVSGSIRALRAVRPANVSATSTVSGTVVHLASILGANVAATSTVSGSVHATRRVAGNISATSTVSGSIVRIVHITGLVSATSTVSGSAGARRPVSGNVLATSTVSGSTVRRVAIRGNIFATSTVSGVLTFVHNAGTTTYTHTGSLVSPTTGSLESPLAAGIDRFTTGRIG